MTRFYISAQQNWQDISNITISHRYAKKIGGKILITLIGEWLHKNGVDAKEVAEALAIRVDMIDKEEKYEYTFGGMTYNIAYCTSNVSITMSIMVSDYKLCQGEDK
jgi:hypothetical protein